MRPSKQRAPVGGPPEAKVRPVGARFADPCTAIHRTPRAEVDSLCHLALLAYLGNSENPYSALLEPRPGGTGDSREAEPQLDRSQWSNLRTTLQQIRVVDPACGEGHMLLGMLDLLDALLGRAEQHLGVYRTRRERRAAIATQSLFGVEVQPDRAKRSRNALAAAASGSDGYNPPTWRPNIVEGDSLLESRGFSWERAFTDVFRTGGFHLVIGNPPFVRHERIRDPRGHEEADVYRERAFTCAEARLSRSLPMPQVKRPTRIDRRADLSLLFAIVGLTLLRDDGALGYVLPAALLQAQYGRSLSRALDHMGRRALVTEDRARRTFSEAGVNTVIFVATPKCSQSSDNLATPALIGETRQTYRTESANNSRADSRAMDLDAAALRSRIAARCVVLGSVGRVRYPVKTGLNRFFYPDGATVQRFDIESRFLLPVVRSPREITSIAMDPHTLKSRLFHCPYPQATLQESGAGGAAAYVDWGANQTVQHRDGEESIRWPDVPSIASRTLWYAVPVPEDAHLLCPRFIHRRYFFALTPRGVTEDQTLYGLVLSQTAHQWRLLVAALLNSSLSYLMLELHGRSGLGGGVRQYALHDMATLPFPDPRRIKSRDQSFILQAFEHLCARAILPIEEEVEQEDRIRLDEHVCAALGIAPRDASAARDLVAALTEQRLRRAACR